MMSLNSAMPQSLQSLLVNDTWHEVTEGKSDARVFRLQQGTHVRYLKISRHDAQTPVKDDKVRLDWLAGRISVPNVLHYCENESQQFLLMTAIEGLHPMHNDLDWSPQERVEFLAQAAKCFHALPLEDCPFIARIDEQIEVARHRIDTAHIKTHLLETQWQHYSPHTLYEKLLSLKPDTEDIVVAHGDLYPINIRAQPAQKSLLGYIDVGRMGLADRYTDLALIANAIRWHLGNDWLPYFFRAYGIETLDSQRLHFYQLINEFL
ncbi:MAG: aminoglycoside 3'-phosphotransferase [Anaerolineae bacterium]|nr:aminoglycoside 3'-phosphotransferase [Anaerolineae bacterium]MDQ7035341.1 aminoglycoside 3'-phosphotransferase [Anaerolineae bacterium]